MSTELKIRLLVVDDEQSIRKLCMTIGTSLNFSCAEAESAEAAVARLDAEAPDLVLTDASRCSRRPWHSRPAGLCPTVALAR